MKKPSLRIIAGRWRGRKLNFPEIEGLRPTGDRIRETIFNWLAPVISGARCLDLFAGSGALGFEALSRGAAHLDFVDASTAVSQSIQSSLERLEETAARVYCQKANIFLSADHAPYDVIFLDPPFAMNALLDMLSLIKDKSLLKPGGVIYFEEDKSTQSALSDWQVVKDKVAGQVRYGLLKAASA